MKRNEAAKWQLIFWDLNTVRDKNLPIFPVIFAPSRVALSQVAMECRDNQRLPRPDFLYPSVELYL